MDYCNTENVTLSLSTDTYPFALLNYSVPQDVNSMEVNVKIKITTTDLMDDINNFLKIEYYNTQEFEIVDDNNFTLDGCFKMNYSSDTGIYYEYDEFSESYQVVSVITQSKTLTIPSTYNNHPVKTIDRNAFTSATEVEELILPDTLTSIPEGLLSGMTNLRILSLPLFNGIHVKTFFGKSSSLPSTFREIIITGGTSIADYAFESCSSLTSITIPNSVTSIGDRAFENCSNLKNVVIPDSVISIGDYAFSWCRSFTSITIPRSVTRIGLGAFDECNGLTRITLPFVGASLNNTSNTHFGYIFGAFSYEDNSSYVPSNLKQVIITDETIIHDHAFFGCDNIVNITIPNSVTSIGLGVFENCSSLTKITIPFVGASLDETENAHFGYIFGASSYSDNSSYVPSSLKEVVITGGKSIGTFAFYHCRSLTSIEIPNNVASIGEYAFEFCSSLRSITIPNSITSIGSRAFYDLDSLINVYYEGTIEDWSKISFDYSSASPMSCARYFYLRNNNNEWEEVTSIEIPDTITEIGNYQFYGFKNVASITIPESVTSIGKYAFDECNNLQYNEYDNGLYLGNSENPYLCLIKIKDTSITSYATNENTKLIYFKAFENCSSLTRITLPFVGASLYETENTHFGYIFGASSYEDNWSWSYVPNSLKEVNILGGSSIGEYAFYDYSSLESITIPDSVISIGEYAFYDCSSLESITISDSVISIGEYAFCDCRSLRSITIPNSVTSIGESAFSGCSNLKSITIPNSVTSIGEGVFSDLDSLINVYYEGTIEDWCNITFSDYDSNPMYYASHFYLRNNNEWEEVTSIEIPDTITEIGQYQFYEFNNVTSIIIPNSVTSIGEWAFSYCSDLTNVYYEGTIEDWYNIAFSSLDSNPMSYANHFYLRNSNNEWEEVTSIEIPDTIREIGDYQFRGFSNITSITIPNCVTSIGKSGFSGCSSLKNVYYEGTIEDWCKISFDYFYSNPMYYASHFYLRNSNNEWEEVTHIEIPDTMTKIGYQFCGFNNVTSIIISNSVISIGEYAFSSCKSLTSITIPNSVTSIGKYAFSNCSNLTSVTIGNSVTSIGDYAFYGCSNSTNVYYEGTIEDWSNIIYIGSYNECLTPSTIYYYSFSKPTEEGNYWHYVDDVVTKWQ